MLKERVEDGKDGGMGGTVTEELRPGEAPAPVPHPLEILGRVVALAMASPSHRHLFLADLEWLAVPAIMVGQFRLFHRDGAPVAFACWAAVSEEVEARLAADEWTRFAVGCLREN